MNRPIFKKSLLDSGAFAYAGLLLITLIGYWPVTTGLFALKNDDIVYFLPYRYNIVEIIRNGHFPLWSPYIYMGFPVSGDMQSGAWNPLVWLLSLTGRYTLTTLHAELMIYIYLGGIGMFKLMAECGFNRMVSFTIAVSYLFCGFILDSGQILCWVTCAGILPFTYLYFTRLISRPTYTRAVKFAFANFFLLVAGYPFFFIANAYFLFFAFIVYLLHAHRTGTTGSLRVFTFVLLSVFLFTLLSAGPLLSFSYLLPHYGRGQALPLSKALEHSYALFSSVSLLFPFSVTKTHTYFFDNGEISRNMYIGVLLLPFVVTGLFQKRGTWWYLILALTLLTFMMSLAQVIPLRKWAYLYLPLMNNFRHPANFRLFVTIGLLALAGKGLQQFFAMPGETKGYTSSIFTVLLVLAGALTFYYLPFGKWLPGHLSLSPHALKMAFDAISFRQAVILSGLIQIPFILAAIYFVRQKNAGRLCLACMLNVIVISQPQQFYSMVGKNPPSGINQYLGVQPAGFPKPDLSHPVWFPGEERPFLEYKEPLESFFNKQVSVNTLITNPTILYGYDRFINDSSLMASARKSPFIYIADSAGDLNTAAISRQNNVASRDVSDISALSILVFEPAGMELSVSVNKPSRLIVLQNHLPGWKAFIDNQPAVIKTVNETCMSIPVPAGSHIVRLNYDPSWFVPGMLLSGAGLLICIILMVVKTSRIHLLSVFHGS